MAEIGPQEGHLKLRIRPDPYCETDKQAHFQWVHGGDPGCLQVSYNSAPIECSGV